MNSRLYRLLEKLTPEEQAEVEVIAMFVLVRRRLQKLQVRTDDISTEELARLVMDSRGSDWLDAPEEDVYSIEDGRAARWPDPS
jgi:hypothetical protein